MIRSILQKHLILRKNACTLYDGSENHFLENAGVTLFEQFWSVCLNVTPRNQPVHGLRRKMSTSDFPGVRKWVQTKRIAGTILDTS